jgi:hypothetical protein
VHCSAAVAASPSTIAQAMRAEVTLTISLEGLSGGSSHCRFNKRGSTSSPHAPVAIPPGRGVTPWTFAPDAVTAIEMLRDAGLALRSRDLEQSPFTPDTSSGRGPLIADGKLIGDP